MNLNFNFNAKTLLSKWWTIVRDNFQAIQSEFNAHVEEFNKQTEEFTKSLDAEITNRQNGDEMLQALITQEQQDRARADNALGERISEETTAREQFDNQFTKDLDAEVTNRQACEEELQNNINAEADNRKEADAALGTRITETAAQFARDLNAEIESRQAGDEELKNKINAETGNREKADAAFGERLSAVEAKAHTHENKDILDGIDADRVRKWDDGSEGQITLGEYLEHLAEAERQFGMLWGLLGMTVYDGGWFGMEQIDAPLDGGDFDGTEFTPLDCGGFEPYVIPSGGGIGTVVDGGTY